MIAEVSIMETITSDINDTVCNLCHKAEISTDAEVVSHNQPLKPAAKIGVCFDCARQLYFRLKPV